MIGVIEGVELSKSTSRTCGLRGRVRDIRQVKKSRYTPQFRQPSTQQAAVSSIVDKRARLLIQTITLSNLRISNVNTLGIQVSPNITTRMRDGNDLLVFTHGKLCPQWIVIIQFCRLFRVFYWNASIQDTPWWGKCTYTCTHLRVNFSS
jgi:hypothetical protein